MLQAICKKGTIVAALSSLLMVSCSENKPAQSDLASLVDPFIGTGFHGHVFLGANVPFGAVQLGPVNRTEGWDWCSGYHYSDSTIIGFSHTHLSGTGIGDLGDILLMPVTENVKMRKGEAVDYASGFLSLFSHDREIAEPGYYAVELDRYKIKAELTASARVGFHQYHFPKDAQRSMVIDMKEGIGWDKATETMLRLVNDSTVEGYRYSTGWAKDQRIYFTAVFSQPVSSFQLFEDTVLTDGSKLTGAQVRGFVTFSGSDSIVKVKVGISPVSMENGQANINVEVPHWNFDKVKDDARDKWNEELNRLRIETNDSSRLRTFYTSLYHTMIAPSVFNDHNGAYRGTDGKIYTDVKFTNLTTFSLWDTYRAVHPLYTLMQYDRVDDMVNSLLAIYQQQGRLPVWHLMGNETNTMPGNSSIQVVADAYLKGYRGFDTTLAWEAVKATAMQDGRGMKWVKERGYIPADSMVESTAMALEYAIADGAIALMAKKMGKEEDYRYFSQRALNYSLYFDRETTFMRGKVSATKWRTPFSPFEARHMADDFCEGNAWQYTWLVPHHVEGIITLLGSEERFIQKLDSLFSTEGHLGIEASADITGLIGQYAHGNEPSHHIAYLYTYAGQPWKTAEKVRYIVDSLYGDGIDGLCGNEDVGQMSAWYIMSSVGLYQVNPAGGQFVIGSPAVNSARFRVAGGKEFTIKAINNSAENKYVQKAELNGKAYDKAFLNYNDITAGGELLLYMGSQPSAEWGVASDNRPYSELYSPAKK
ncbi:MAG: GH92 family glycosyl hydrolase [Chitinophagaceae bacterium]|nr:GH92 family glycosyl hydrolase [Chitinophagaceae bacterium]